MNFFKRFRTGIQISFFVFSILLLVLLFLDVLKIVHEYCPYSIICFGAISLKQGMIFYPISLLIFGLLAFSALFLGRWFCGYVCFIGSLQEWIYQALHPNCRAVVKINYIDERRLGWLKYLILLATIVLIFSGMSYVYMGFCPVLSLGWLKTIFITGIITLGVILIGGLFIERFWCRYLCPYAALLNIIQIIGKKVKIKQYKINRNLETCIDCMICCKVCPMNINLLEAEEIEHENCIKCFRCSQKCPKKGTLKGKW